MHYDRTEYAKGILNAVHDAAPTETPANLAARAFAIADAMVAAEAGGQSPAQTLADWLLAYLTTSGPATPATVYAAAYAAQGADSNEVNTALGLLLAAMTAEVWTNWQQVTVWSVATADVAAVKAWLLALLVGGPLLLEDIKIEAETAGHRPDRTAEAVAEAVRLAEVLYDTQTMLYSLPE